MNAMRARAKSEKQSGRDAMMQEIKRQCGAYHRKHTLEIMSVFLWYEREKKHHGYDYLKDMFFDFFPMLREFLNRYELEDNDLAWLCSHKLKEELGIDIEEWSKEFESYESKTEKQKT